MILVGLASQKLIMFVIKTASRAQIAHLEEKRRTAIHLQAIASHVQATLSAQQLHSRVHIAYEGIVQTVDQIQIAQILQSLIVMLTTFMIQMVDALIVQI